MTLQEKAFMIDLINRNYRRRISRFTIGFISIIVGVAGTLLIDTTKIPMPLDLIIISVNVIFVITGIILVVLNNKPSDIRKAQYTALEEQYTANADFEELLRCVPLKEYFEI